MIRRFARPYAKAMMDVVADARQGKELLARLEAFERTRRRSPELRELFENPGVETEAKLNVVRQVAEKLGVAGAGLRLVEVLVKNHRANDLGAVLEAWDDMLNEKLGIAVASVRTAHPIDEQERARLRSALESRLGRTIELELETDPSLLGGFVARVESEVWDASVRGRLAKLRSSLTQ